MDFVCDQAHADARAADQDCEVCLAANNRATRRLAVIGVFASLLAVRAEIENLISFFADVRKYRILQNVSAVIARECNSLFRFCHVSVLPFLC